MSGKWRCRKEESDNLNTKVYVPVKRVNGRSIKKYASLGEKEEYSTKKSCFKRLKTLNK